MMRIGSLFAGVGGLELGLEWAGVGHTVWQVEKEPFCRAVLAKHWPHAVRHDDVMTVGAHNLDPVDVICGGFPCQDISYAGKGAGLAGERSGLWYEYARIVRELAPRFVVVENVSALLTRGLDAVLGTLASLGYDAEWSCVRASDVGARHRRERVFVIAWRLDDADDARLEGRGVRGQQRADERPAGAAGGEGVGDADSRGCEPSGRPRVGAEMVGGREGAGYASEVEDAGALAHPRRCGIERRRGLAIVDGAEGPRDREGAERQRDGHAARDCGSASADVADSDSGRCVGFGLGGLLDGERTERGNDSDGCRRAWHLGWKTGGGRQVDGPTQPRVGRATHGLSARLDVARPGEAQAEWEAPRTVEKAHDRTPRLRALGNAVVPQVAELVGRRLMEIAGGR